MAQHCPLRDSGKYWRFYKVLNKKMMATRYRWNRGSLYAVLMIAITVFSVFDFSWEDKKKEFIVISSASWIDIIKGELEFITRFLDFIYRETRMQALMYTQILWYKSLFKKGLSGLRW